jgi:hypothetical protein
MGASRVPFSMPRAAAALLLAGTVVKAQTDPQRPLYHVMPENFWMNDPNGPVWINGLYHLFSQYNPWQPVWVSAADPDGPPLFGALCPLRHANQKSPVSSNPRFHVTPTTAFTIARAT